MLRARRRARRGVEMLVRDARPGVMRIDVHRRDWTRTVSVLVDGRAPEFPHVLTDGGESTGDPKLDSAVRAYVQQQLAARAAERPRPRGRRL